MDKKSQENLDSSDLLIHAGKYSSSIHCSYYAVFQYMKYALKNSPQIPMSYSDQNRMTSVGKSHIRILRAFKKRMERIDNNMKDASLIGNRIELLKDDRIKADYQLDAFDAKKKSILFRRSKINYYFYKKQIWNMRSTQVIDCESTMIQQFMAIIREYNNFSIKYEYSNQRKRILVSYLSKDFILNDPVLLRKINKLEDSLKLKYANYPLFCYEEDLFKLSKNAKTLNYEIIEAENKESKV